MSAGRSTKEEFVASIIVVAFVIAVFAFMATVEMMHCPKCENHEPEKYSCTYCGGDGKVTLLQYLAIVLTQGYSIVKLDRLFGLLLSTKKHTQEDPASMPFSDSLPLATPL